MKLKIILLVSIFCFGFDVSEIEYPIDGYESTGIKRLKRLQLIESDDLSGRKLIKGATKSIKDIKLNLPTVFRDDAAVLFQRDSALQKKLEELFPNLHESYSVALMDVSEGKQTRYAAHQETRYFQPGSVGKLAIVVGFFNELSKIYPDSFELRKELMRTRSVKAGQWGIYDEHTVPFFNIETNKLVKRQVTPQDIFTLYEWVDHMMSVSNNGAASIVWREAILMNAFGKDYPTLTQEKADEYFKETSRSVLMDLQLEVVNTPLRTLGIGHDEWRLGTMFTRGASGIIPGKGGSAGSPLGLMKFLVALERGVIVDYLSSLEIKRLMYMTDRRIRYGANRKLRDAALYFKSGSLYSCDRSRGGGCGKYKGNVKNYMNSVAIVEQPDGNTYLVVLMTNVLRKNSNIDHNVLAGRIDKIVRES